MATYRTEEIRNVALVGQTGTGKTTLAENLLFRAGAISQMGSVQKGTTVCDFDPQEKTHQHSLDTAVVRMGTTSVRNVVTAVCVASILADKGAYGTGGRQLMDHGIGTAYLAWLLADTAGGARDEAFVCGLLHDIGKLLIQQLAHHPHSGIKKPSAAEVSTVMSDRHAALGGHLLESWRLPTALHEAVAFHHAPGDAPHSGAATVAYAANRLAHRFGFGCPVEEFDPLTDPVFPAMKVDEAGLARIEKQARKMYDVARQLSV